MDETGPTRAPGLNVPWAVLSMVLAVVALATLGTLAVVVGIKEIDVLSTVALALAILSFASQIIVTLIQSQQVAALNADTKSALAEIKATTSSLLSNQRDQFDVVLKAVLRLAVPAAVQDLRDETAQTDQGEDSTVESSELSQELEERLIARFEEVLRSSTTQPRAGRVLPKVDRGSDDVRQLMRTFPDEAAGRRAREALDGLSPRALSTLDRIGQQLKRTGNKDYIVTYHRKPTGMGMSFKELIEQGIIEEASAPALGEAGTARYRLTPPGLLGARVLTGEGETPEWVR
jgi:hypothetical protein